MNTAPGPSPASVRRFVLCLLAVLAATACGQRGPLYLPQSEPPSQSRPEPPSAPAAQPGDSADEDEEEEEESAEQE